MYRANDTLTAEEVTAAAEQIKSSKLLLCQNEIPIERTIQALTCAKRNNVMTVFNPAPATKHFPEQVFSLVDIWCVNQTELEIVSQGSDTRARCKHLLHKSNCAAVIVTMGSKGSLLITGEGFIEVPAIESIDVVDTTGAGDAYIAGFATGYLATKSIKEACMIASKVSAATVQHRGCQASYEKL